MAYDEAAKLLYVADTGNGRVVRLDPSTGTMTGPASPVYEPLAVNKQFEGAELVEIVRPGTITHPSGLLLHEGKLYVADNATGIIHALELDGTPIATLNTNLAPGALTGLTVGPDGKLYFTDMLSSEVLRVDPQ
jgi:sugar lactone lactonase YvrE